LELMDKALNSKRIYYSFIRISNKKFNHFRVYSTPRTARKSYSAGKKVLVQKSSSQYTALVHLYMDMYIFDKPAKYRISIKFVIPANPGLTTQETYHQISIFERRK
jgi:hypothetical protein